MLRHIGAATLPPAFAASAVRLRLVDGPLDLHWQHCGMTSDFLGTFFAAGMADPSVDPNEVRHNIGYLVNEVLENAVKFRSSGDVVVGVLLQENNFMLSVTNLIETEHVARFQDILSQFDGNDPGELLIERIERNAADPESNASGLGLLTLMSDYGVRLGWGFRACDDRAAVQIETQAVLPLA